MIRRVGNKYIAETSEGDFELDSACAYRGIAREMLELIQQDSGEGLERVNSAVDYYRMSGGLLQSCRISNQDVIEYLVPIMEQLSDRSKEPKLCEVIARYVVREAWYSIQKCGNSELLWELFKFYRDKVLPLIFYSVFSYCEQYLRISRAFYLETGLSSYEGGSFLSTTYFFKLFERSNRKYGTTISEYLREGDYYKSTHGSTKDVFIDLIRIPELLAGIGIGFQRGFSDEQLAVFKTTKQCAERFYLMNDCYRFESCRKLYGDFAGYQECVDKSREIGWNGYGFLMATALCDNKVRNKIAKEYGFTRSDLVQYKVDGNSANDVLSNFLSWLVIGVEIAIFIVGTYVGIEVGSKYGVIFGMAAAGSIYTIVGGATSPLFFAAVTGIGHVGVTSSGDTITWV